MNLRTPSASAIKTLKSDAKQWKVNDEEMNERETAEGKEFACIKITWNFIQR